MKDIYQSCRLDWQGIEIDIRYCPNRWTVIGHFEIESACRSPLPIAETGFVSHFVSDERVKGLGGPASYVEAWLAESSADKGWKDAEERRRQLTLF